VVDVLAGERQPLAQRAERLGDRRVGGAAGAQHRLEAFGVDLRVAQPLHQRFG
jgi:hypothetical protein